ncbi:hypothetical protein FQV23_0014203, partial [Spheniscus humboldti]
PQRGDGVSPLCVCPPDWHHLRVAGLVVAAILCVIGIIVLLSECHRRVPVSLGEVLVSPGGGGSLC